MSCRLLEKYFAEKHGSSIDKSFRGIPIGMSLYDSLNLDPLEYLLMTVLV